MQFVFVAKGANHNSLFAIGQLFETDALIFFYDFGCFLENIFFKPEPINLTLQFFGFTVKLFDLFSTFAISVPYIGTMTTRCTWAR